MRALAVGLLLASGCNQIFGLHDNVVNRDAAVMEFHDAPDWPMQLTWQLVADSTGAVTYPPIDGATVAIGPIDPADGPLVNLPIDPIGGFLIPREIPNQPYKLVYTVAHVPTEIQSMLHTGHFVVPMVGRLDREPTPSHALVRFDPMGLPVNPIPSARIMTVGLWTSSSYPNGAQINLPFDWDYQQYGVSMAGTQGSLRGGTDLEILCSLTTGDCDGYATMSVAQLFENGQGIATGTSTWVVPTKTAVDWMTPNDGSMFDPDLRLTGAVFNYGSTVKTKTEWAGAIPSSLMPSFVQPTPGGLDGVQLAPLSTNDAFFPHRFVNPFEAMSLMVANSYPLVAYAQNTSTRTVAGGATLTSGFQAIGLPPTAGAKADVRYKVGIAHLAGNDVTLTPEGHPGAGTVLNPQADGVSVDLMGDKLVDLTFSTDINIVDDCVVTIYQISGTSVIPVRRLLLQAPPKNAPFRLDASVFAPATTYTLGVVCRKGQPGVASGDYSMVSYPYVTSTLYTPTFTVKP